MDKNAGSPVWRQVRRLLFAGLFLFAVVIAAGVVYLRTRPAPSPESITEAGHKYKEIRALYHEDAPATATLAAASSSKSTSATLALQAECDRLLLDILNASRGKIFWQSRSYKIMAHADQAKLLATFYDKGLKISPEARREFEQAFAGQAICNMANYLIYEIGPADTDDSVYGAPGRLKIIAQLDPAGRTRMLGRIVEACKLLRVIDSPVPYAGFDLFFRDVNILGTEQQETYPPELMNFDLELLAPRRALDWNHFVALELDWYHAQTLNFQTLLQSPNAYRYWLTQSDDMYPPKWYKPFQKQSIAIGGALVGRMFFGTQLKMNMQTEDAIQQYAAAVARRDIDPAKLDYWATQGLQNGNDQLHSRLLAGAVELRRGAAVPAADKIGPESYFFDPISQRPYQFYTTPAPKDGAVYLHVYRTVAPYECGWDETMTKRVTSTEDEVKKIYLPANHPGLANIPKRR